MPKLGCLIMASRTSLWLSDSLLEPQLERLLEHQDSSVLAIRTGFNSGFVHFKSGFYWWSGTFIGKFLLELQNVRRLIAACNYGFFVSKNANSSIFTWLLQKDGQKF